MRSRDGSVSGLIPGPHYITHTLGMKSDRALNSKEGWEGCGKSGWLVSYIPFRWDSIRPRSSYATSYRGPSGRLNLVSYCASAPFLTGTKFRDRAHLLLSSVTWKLEKTNQKKRTISEGSSIAGEIATAASLPPARHHVIPPASEALTRSSFPPKSGRGSQPHRR